MSCSTFPTFPKEQTDALIKGFEGLKDIPEVRAFEWGTEINAEDSSPGFTHCFFNDFGSRKKYLNSREHRDYEIEVIKYRNKVLVFDFQTKVL